MLPDTILNMDCFSIPGQADKWFRAKSLSNALKCCWGGGGVISNIYAKTDFLSDIKNVWFRGLKYTTTLGDTEIFRDLT